MDAAMRVADYYTELISRCGKEGCPSRLPETDRIIWYIISTRCEIDINGFGSVFEQLLTERELLFLIGSLRRLDEPRLAAAFDRVHKLLQGAGFFQNPKAMCADLDPLHKQELEKIEKIIDTGQAMWKLDEKLANLIDS